jgi:Zinc-finger associated domain (zf-AD)
MSFDYDVVPQGTQITDCCRICLSDTELLDMKSNEFSNNDRALNYYHLFRECSGLQTNEIFILPTGKGHNAFKICKLCIVQLESCYTFRDLCRQANTILTDRYLMQTHNESIVDEDGQSMENSLQNI